MTLWLFGCAYIWLLYTIVYIYIIIIIYYYMKKKKKKRNRYIIIVGKNLNNKTIEPPLGATQIFDKIHFNFFFNYKTLEPTPLRSAELKKKLKLFYNCGSIILKHNNPNNQQPK